MDPRSCEQLKCVCVVVSLAMSLCQHSSWFAPSAQWEMLLRRLLWPESYTTQPVKRFTGTLAHGKVHRLHSAAASLSFDPSSYSKGLLSLQGRTLSALHSEPLNQVAASMWTYWGIQISLEVCRPQLELLIRFLTFAGMAPTK